ncbi:MAG: glycoside hydrolase family 2 TIM barrel-domain containing protein, partial [Candidatus Scatosoma sp.]
MISEQKTVVKIKANDLSGRALLSLRAEKYIDRVILTVKESDARESVFPIAVNGEKVEYEFRIENPVLWSVSSPFLYDYSLDVIYNDGSEKISGKFGFRNLSANGKEICLNGRPLFIRGYIRGVAAHEHANNCGLSAEEFYRKNIRNAKKFGFNFVRFHSLVPDETFFRIADEEGILVHIEMRLPDDIYNNLREMPESGGIFVPDEYVLSTVEKLYNHPSLCVYCIGNEIKDAGSGN